MAGRMSSPCLIRYGKRRKPVLLRAVGGVGKYSSSWLLPRCRRSSPRCPTAFCQSTHGFTLGRIGPLAMLSPIAILALKA